MFNIYLIELYFKIILFIQKFFLYASNIIQFNLYHHFRKELFFFRNLRLVYIQNHHQLIRLPFFSLEFSNKI